MFHASAQTITSLLTSYGYLAVLVLVGIESMGIPVPGETMLLTAAIFAGTTHQLQIGWIIAAAAAGAILGDNLGFWIGHTGGYRLLRKYGRYIRVTEAKLKLGWYLFDRHGGKVVFFGRFVAVLRALAAFLAGTNRMKWDRFLIANATGGILWATIFGMGGYLLGDNVQRLEGTLRNVAIVIAVVGFAATVFVLRRNEARLEAEAEQAYPGPIEQYEGQRQAAGA
ncbi:MAG: DedA family protein [Herpetosiphon sp.]